MGKMKLLLNKMEQMRKKFWFGSVGFEMVRHPVEAEPAVEYTRVQETDLVFKATGLDEI